MNSDMSEARRSSRPHVVAKVASYGEDVDVEHPPMRKRVKTTSSKRYNERKPHQEKIATTEQRANAMERAEKLKSGLASDHPSFIRSMVRSHVYTCYWLSIPTPFCNAHLPKNDHNIILEDEKGEEHNTNFLAKRTGLSGGWRGFALKQKLHDGDAVIFELTNPDRFKVYIIRAHDDLDEENDVMVSVEEQNMEKGVDDKLLASEKPVEELADSTKEKAAPKPRVDGSRKRSRRKPTKPVKSDDGVSSSKMVEEEDDLIDDAIVNGPVATDKPGEPVVTSKIKLFRRRNVARTKLFSMRRTWPDVEEDIEE